jgi:hypothetical protein
VPGAAIGTLLLNDTPSRAEAQFAYLGHWLATVPFSAAVCRVGHGNNASGRHNRIQTVRMFLGGLRRTRLVTPTLKKSSCLVDRMTDRIGLFAVQSRPALPTWFY